MLLECHALTMNTIVFQLSDAVAAFSMLQSTAHFRIPIINAHFVADNATHALASSATAKPTFNVVEEVVVIRNGWTPKRYIYTYIYIHSIIIFHICMSLFESTLLSFCKSQSKLDLPTLRQSNRERKIATEQSKI